MKRKGVWLPWGFKAIVKSTYLGFNIILSSSITQEGLGWKHDSLKVHIFNPYIIDKKIKWSTFRIYLRYLQ